MTLIKLGLLTFTEKLLRWCIHPRLRGRLLAILGARIGRGVRINEIWCANPVQGFGNLTIGDHAYVGQKCLLDLTGPIRIGSRTSISPSCSLITHSDPGSMFGNRLAMFYPRKIEGITIGDDCWIGAGSIILCGVTIGDRVVIGAGSVVTKSVCSNALFCGNPARFIKHLDPS